MKRKFTILFLLISSTSFCQEKLEGTYCSPSDFAGYCITFKSDSMFDYSIWSCTGSEVGKGTYNLHKKKLSLLFTNTDTLENSFVLKKTRCETFDSSTLNFLVKEKEYNDPLPLVKINLTSSFNITNDFISDLDGKATIKTKKSSEEFDAIIHYPGYKTFTIKLKTDTCFDITVSLTYNSNKILKTNTKWEFKVKTQNQDKLALKKRQKKIILTKQKK